MRIYRVEMQWIGIIYLGYSLQRDILYRLIHVYHIVMYVLASFTEGMPCSKILYKGTSYISYIKVM